MKNGGIESFFCSHVPSPLPLEGERGRRRLGREGGPESRGEVVDITQYYVYPGRFFAVQVRE